jgi:serine phosphatase RsbU (regulator of sigma subunit)
MDLQKHFLRIFASIMTLMLLSIFLYLKVLDNEAKIAEASERRYRSYLLADELRQSSDDLTRMARTYAVTGDPKFEEYFDTILAIRSGDASRPVDYHNIYWDLVSAAGVPPRVDTPPRALKELMKEARFTENEFALLQEAEDESNELVSLENRAMNAMVGIFEDAGGRYSRGTPDRKLARELLHGEQYHAAKAKIMNPLNKFFEALDHRTSGQIAVFRDKGRRLNLILMAALGLSATLALISLLLGAASAKKKTAQTGKSRLAQRLAASGYGSVEAGAKNSARDALVKRLTSKTQSAEDKDEATSDMMYLQFFIRTFWQNWPFISAALVVTFMTLGLSWWFLSENRIQSYAKVRDELKFTLDTTQAAVLDWMRQSSQDAVHFAQAAGRRASYESLRLLKDFPHHALHRQLATAVFPDGREGDADIIGRGPGQFAEDSGIANTEIFEDYLVVDREGTVLSGSRPELIGKFFAFPSGTMERLLTQKTIIDFPDGEAAGDLLSRNIVFGALMDENKGAVFIMASPQRMLAKILRRGYSGNYGEVYLVDAQGRFISEPRWKEQVLDQGWVDPDTQSIIGMYASRQGKAAPPGEMPLSVRRATAGDSGGELDEYENYLGNKVVGYWDWNNTHGFGIINEYDSDKAFATFRAFKRQALAGSGFTAALILTLTLLFIWSRNKVTRANEQLKGAFKTIKSHNDKLAQDLRIGQKVQMDMLPDPIEGEGFTLEAFLKPAQSVSGDFYDFSMIRDGKVYFCVGDVSGKGIPASLFMSMSKALLSKVLDQADQTKDIITRVNNELSLNNDSNMFVTLVIGVMDLNTGELLITNAGHNLPYIKKHTGELVCLEEIQGPLVGTFEGIEFKQQSIQMGKGDMVLFYTDGVIEAQNIRDEFYDDNRLEDLLKKNEFDTAKDMTNSVFRSVLRFIGRADQFDDITILSFQYTGL